jgi:hypothetical protein
MKRADLAVGMEVLVSRDQDWQRWTSGERVLVVDLGDWHIRSAFRSYGVEAPTIELDGETYTLSTSVMQADDLPRRPRNPVNAFIGRAYGHDGLSKPKAYRLLHAKGPWAEAKAVQEKNDQARKAELAKDKTERNRLEVLSADLAGRMVDLGVNAGYLTPNSQGRAMLTFDQLEKLIELAEANRS